MRQKTRALCSTKSNSSLAGTSLVPLAVCSVFAFRCWNSSSSDGSSLSGFPTSILRESGFDLAHAAATSSIGD